MGCGGQDRNEIRSSSRHDNVTKVRPKFSTWLLGKGVNEVFWTPGWRRGCETWEQGTCGLLGMRERLADKHASNESDVQQTMHTRIMATLL